LALSKRENELYISMDVEADGPIPGIHSMLSFGAVAFLDGQILGGFYANIQPLEKGVQDKDTMENFWQKFPDAWNYIHHNPQYPMLAPLDAMTGLVDWLSTFNKPPILVAYPAAFDFMFIYWYLIAFLQKSPFGYSALDMKSYAMCKLDATFTDSVKGNMPKDWFEGLPYTHCAFDDALEQGCTFMHMLGLKKETFDFSKVAGIR